MNKQNPSDPIHFSNDADPSNRAGESSSEPSQSSQAASGGQARQTRTRRARRKKVAGYRARIEAMIAELRAKLGSLDHDRLKKILIACGIAAVLVVAIVALIKSIPVGLAILAILGLGVVVRFLEELRHMPVLNTL